MFVGALCRQLNDFKRTHDEIMEDDADFWMEDFYTHDDDERDYQLFLDLSSAVGKGRQSAQLCCDRSRKMSTASSVRGDYRPEYGCRLSLSRSKILRLLGLCSQLIDDGPVLISICIQYSYQELSCWLLYSELADAFSRSLIAFFSFLAAGLNTFLAFLPPIR